ncbi:serine palmitoyltransferase, LCB1 subunit [Oceanobacillus picturae]|uniref:Serine palmitoyltransferase, LCB1 subunit n=2 Tax=Oceanobacillus picturae TaxID=171693 RepID=A0A0U9H9Q4_9BACI|nr:serine palmitoyltransferase, LCB1 subunit [Oceanobacillus picturae]
MGENTSALATYLVALAILESNGDTFVSREIRDTIDQLKTELNMKKYK